MSSKLMGALSRLLAGRKPEPRVKRGIGEETSYQGVRKVEEKTSCITRGASDEQEAKASS